MIIPAKDATHARCIDCDTETPLDHVAQHYDDATCENCETGASLLLIQAEPLRSVEEDEDYLRDRTWFGGPSEYVYEVFGDAL